MITSFLQELVNREVVMQKISPLRASVAKAFNDFKANRAKKAENNENLHTNPFGITFRGVLLQSDVFESSAANQKPALKDRLASGTKLLASAWVGTINKFNSMKGAAISFGRKIKETTKNTIDMLNNTNVEFDIFKYNVSRLQKQPVSELEDMLRKELGA